MHDEVVPQRKFNVFFLRHWKHKIIVEQKKSPVHCENDYSQGDHKRCKHVFSQLINDDFLNKESDDSNRIVEYLNELK